MGRRSSATHFTLGWIDYALMGIAMALATYSIGVAVARPGIAMFMVGLVCLGTGFSYVIRIVLRRSNVIKVDWVLYAGAVLGAMFFWQVLQGVLPEEGFPRELAPAAWLTWAIALGAFFCWQDGTLLFGGIPAIALFGLVGCYDTFRNVTFCFFGFLACLVTMFARAHGRAMFRQAIDSGYFNRIHYLGEGGSIAEDDAVSYQKIKEGPWRWVAGPEWALVSALAIILLSLLGAPVIQSTVKSVAGSMAVSLPQSVRAAANSTAQPRALGNDTQGTYQIGRGPNNVRDVKVFEVDLDQPRYLRTETFATYTGRFWRGDWSQIYQLATQRDLNAPTVASVSIEEIRKFKAYEFAIRPVVATRVYPSPAEVVMKTLIEVNQRLDGTLEATRQASSAPLSGQSLEPDGKTEPRDAVKALPASLAGIDETPKTSERVIDLARKVAQGGKTDYERAKLVQHEIERRVKYNLNAAACPSGVDPVDYFLFEGHEGYCDLFASSMTVMSRAIGLPARYVIGYRVDGAMSAGEGSYVVRESDAHAWCEIFFKDVGWVIFDATEGADSVPGGERGSTSRGFFDRPAVKAAMTTIGVILTVALGFAILWGKQRAFRPRSAKVALDRAHVAFCRAIQAEGGARRRLSSTTAEFVESNQKVLGELAAVARTFAERFDRAYYSPRPLDAESARRLLSEVAAFRKSLKRRPRR